MDVCPTIQEIQSLLDECLTDDRVPFVFEHLETCKSCQSKLEQMTCDSHPTLVGTGLVGKAEIPEGALDRWSQRLAREMQSPDPERVSYTEVSSGGVSSVGVSSVGVSSGGVPSSHRQAVPVQFGDYRLECEIGRGGMGVVYRARHQKLNRVVAIKVLEASEIDRQDDGLGRLARFQREVRAIGSLHHPNIVSAFDAGESGRFHYLVMEYIDGINLRQLVRKRGPLGLADACEAARQAATGLQHSHEAGLVHRDIKPSNLMLAVCDGKPIIKILDLGLARFREWSDSGEMTLTRAGQMVGTLNYMAPEQMEERPVDIRADIYSLGATLFLLLTGRSHLPDSGEGVLQKLRVRATEAGISLAEVCPELPTEITGLVDQMLADDPEDRPFVPSEVAERLAPFCVGQNLAHLLPEQAFDIEQDTGELAALLTRVDTTRIDLGSSSGTGAPSINPSALLPVRESPGHTAASGGRRPPVFKWAVLGGFFGLLALAGIVIRLQTSGGAILIECHDPDIQVEIVRNGTEVTVMEAGQLADATWFRAGEYELRIPRTDADRIVIDQRRFVLNRGETKLVTISPAGNGQKDEASVWVPDLGSYYLIESKWRPGLVLEVEQARVAYDTNVSLSDSTGEDHQQFRFVPAGKGRYFIETKLASKFGLDISNWGRDDETNISLVQRGEIETLASKFVLFDADEGYVRIVSAMGENFHVGVADDDQNIVSRNRFRGERTLFKLTPSGAVPEKDNKAAARPVSSTEGKYVTFEFEDGGRYLKNLDGSWTVYYATGDPREMPVRQVSEGDQLPVILDDPYHQLWFRFSQDRVDASEDEGKTWLPFYSGEGHWVIPPEVNR